MSSIILHVRPWNNRYMLELSKKLISLEGYNEVIFVTMFSESNDFFLKRKLNVIWLPKELKKIKLDTKRLKDIDSLLTTSNDVNINHILETERFFDKDSLNENYFYSYALLLDQIISKNDISISFSLDHFVYYYSAELTKAKGGFHYSFVPVGVPFNSVVALKSPWSIIPNKHGRKMKKEFFTGKLNIPTSERLVYMNKQKIPSVFKTNSRNFIRFNILDKKENNYLNNDGYSLTRKIRNKFRSKESFYIPKIMGLEITGKFVYIPLHMEPEATVIMYSSYFQNQIEMIRIVSKVLPIGWKIYIKENPKMLLNRSKYFYQKINEIPNIEFVSMEIESVELIKKCEVVVALSGTSSLEAYLLKKPALLFGTPPHHNLLKYAGYGVNFGMEELKMIFSRDNLNYKEFYNDEKWDEYISATLGQDMIPRYNDHGQLELLPKDSQVRDMFEFIKDTSLN